MRRAPDFPVRLAAALTALMGAVNVISALTPPLIDRLRWMSAWSPLEVREGGRLAAAVSGFVLLVLARGLWRRKRAAWVLTQIALTVSAISHIVKGLSVEEAVIAVSIALYLLAIFPHFHARPDPPSLRRVGRVLLAAAGFTFLYGAFGFWLLDRQLHVHFDVWAAARETLVMFAQLRGPELPAATRFGRWFVGSVFAVGVCTAGSVLALTLRSVLIRTPATNEERKRARGIVEAFGRSSLARVALLEDKSYYFSPGGSVVAYVVKAGVAVALGDVMGPEADLGEAILGYTTLCERNGWNAAFYQVLPDALDAYRQAGFETLCIGEEAIVRTATFTMSGTAHRGLRSTIHHLERLGYHSRVLEPPLSSETLRELHSISDEWLTRKRGREKRFSVGWFDDAYIRDAPVMLVRGPGDRILAFANLVPEYRRNELTIDLMRHRAEMENGGMEFLIVALIQWAHEHGYESFNLGLCALAGVGEHREDPVVEKALHFVFEHIQRFYSFQGLHAFKSKFGPEWSPRFLVYPGTGDLLAVISALILADSGASVFARTPDAAKRLLGLRSESGERGA
jgi:phosphatidylglycerol lysyltransferase